MSYKCHQNGVGYKAYPVLGFMLMRTLRSHVYSQLGSGVNHILRRTIRELGEVLIEALQSSQ